MNFYVALKTKLIDNGLFDHQAEQIMAIAMEHESFSNMRNRWLDDCNSCGPIFDGVLFALLRPITYDWICKNAPKAWYRVVFSPGIVGLQAEELNEYISQYNCKANIVITQD